LEKFILVLSTVPDEESGQKIARALLMEKLAACVTVSPASRSHYWWKGEISEDEEHILFIKTKASLFSELDQKIQETHPYEVPEIIALPLLKGSEKYLSWLDKETRD
jgi:periplasmic divalent cation tolerance protein